jgi:hypothetical protein
VRLANDHLVDHYHVLVNDEHVNLNDVNFNDVNVDDVDDRRADAGRAGVPASSRWPTGSQRGGRTAGRGAEVWPAAPRC